MQVVAKVKPIEINFTCQQIVDGLKNDVDLRKLQLFQNNFFQKFKGYIYKIAIQKCVNFSDSRELATDITQQTFISAFRKIKNFDLSRESDSTKHEAILKAWLGIIANNCFNKEYAKKKNWISIDDLELGQVDTHYDLFDSLYGEEPIETPNEFRLKLREVMKNLTEVQRHVIETYANEGCINDPTRKLSSNAMSLLCELHTTNSANIRQIKKRTLDKIKKHCF